MNLYRARAWRGPGPPRFDPLDSTGSVAGAGWRFNDIHSEILYTATVESLAVLEVVIRPGWETVHEVLIATIEIPAGSIVSLDDLDMVLPSDWNARPVAADSRRIAGEFLDALKRLPKSVVRPIGLRVPSVLSASDHNVLIDPSRKADCRATRTHRMPFRTFVSTSS